jgi:biopolymer transport protein ExbD
MGPAIGEIPLKMQGKLNDEKLYVTIDIDMQTMLGQIVHVQLGTDDFTNTGTKGDLNGDGKVDIADAVSILNVMAEGSNDKAADLNGDGKVDIADFVSVLNIMAEN